MYLNGQNSFHLARAAGFWLLLYAGANAQTADSTAYTITTLAGGGNLNGISALSVNLTSVAFGNPLTTDSAGNVYLASGVDNRVYKLDVNGVLTVVAGNGLFGDTGDGGNAQDAELGGLAGVAVDASGSVYIAELHGSRVRKVSNGAQPGVRSRGRQRGESLHRRWRKSNSQGC
jgi:hypothetical protein